MTLYDRVSWREGMALLPQHFSQLERSLSAQWQGRLQATAGVAWGLLELSFDALAIGQGRLELNVCRAVLPDGLFVDVPHMDAAPAPRSFELPDDASVVEVWLAVPVRRGGHALIAASRGRQDARYVEATLQVDDDLQPGRVQPIQVGEKNLQLLITGDRMEGMVTLKLAELRRGRDGRPQLCADFVPPVAAIGASEALMRLVRRVAERVSTRAASLSTERRRGSHTLEFTTADVERFWFLHTLNQHRATLVQLSQMPDTAPCALFLELLRLAGSLSTFASDELKELPRFRQSDPGPAFVAVVDQITGLLAKLWGTAYEAIPLTRHARYWQAQISDRSQLEGGIFVLEVLSELPPHDVLTKLPGLFKMSSPDRIDHLVRLALKGVELSPRAKPPTSMPYNPQACYFDLQAQGEHWRSIVEAGQLAAYVPTWLSGLGRLTLFALPVEGR